MPNTSSQGHSLSPLDHEIEITMRNLRRIDDKEVHDQKVHETVNQTMPHIQAEEEQSQATTWKVTADAQARQKKVALLASINEQVRKKKNRGHESPHHHVPQFEDENDDVNLDDIGEIGAIVPPLLPAGIKFNIATAMI